MGTIFSQFIVCFYYWNTHNYWNVTCTLYGRESAIDTQITLCFLLKKYCYWNYLDIILCLSKSHFIMWSFLPPFVKLTWFLWISWDFLRQVSTLPARLTREIFLRESFDPIYSVTRSMFYCFKIVVQQVKIILEIIKMNKNSKNTYQGGSNMKNYPYIVW